MKKIFKEAHKMTKEMVKKYKVDYITQFGLNLSYLLEKKEEVKMLKELKGTDKQIKFSNDIAKGFIDIVKDLEGAIEKYSKSDKMKDKYIRVYNEDIKPIFEGYENAGNFINDWKHMLDRTTKGERLRRLIDTLEERNDIKISERIVTGLQEEYFEEER